MTDGYMVQEIEAYLKLYRAWPRTSATNHRWQEMARKVWYKTFSTSGQTAGHPPQPTDLAKELASMPSALAAAIHVLASAKVAMSGHQAQFADEFARYSSHYRRYIATRRGRARQRYLKQNPIALDVAG